MTQQDYDVEIRQRFDRPQVAAEYVIRKNRLDTAKNRREMACIERVLTGVAPGSVILDLPTGTGRLLPMLLGRGYRVVAGDYSAHMLAQARNFIARSETGLSDEHRARVESRQQDIMRTDLADGAIDVAISNRLFHHYPTAELRRRALAELARVTNDRIIVSYFSNVVLSALRFHAKNLLLSSKPNDRVPIWPAVFAANIAAVGLRVKAAFPVRYGLSPQTYLWLQKAG